MPHFVDIFMVIKSYFFYEIIKFNPIFLLLSAWQLATCKRRGLKLRWVVRSFRKGCWEQEDFRPANALMLTELFK
jgi:hypothetical protein